MLYNVIKTKILYYRGRLLTIFLAVIFITIDIYAVTHPLLDLTDWIKYIFCFSVLFMLGYIIDRSYKLRVNSKFYKEMYRSLFDHNTDASYNLSNTGKFLRVNDATTTITGYTQKELLKMNFQPIIAEYDRERVVELFNKVLNGESINFDTSINQKSGALRELSITAVPTIVGGNVVGCIGIAKDVTEQRWNEKRLEETFHTLEDMKYTMDASSAYTVTDVNGIILFTNVKASELTGYCPEELIGKTFHIVSASYHDKTFWNNMWSTIRSGEVWTGEVKNKNKKGEEYWVDTTIVPFVNEAGPYQFAVIHKDITDRKKLEIHKQKELLLATELQKGILPTSFKTDVIEVSGLYIPSEELSGDMYYWIQIDEDKFGVIIIDIVGHGVTASLVNMAIRPLLNTLITKGQDPEIIMKELNQHIFKLFKDNKSYDSPIYFTSIYFLIDTKMKNLEYVCAGHPPALLLEVSCEAEKLDIGTIPVGLFHPSMFNVEKGSTSYKPNSTLFLYTDGLADALGGFVQTENYLKELCESQNIDSMMEKVQQKLTEGNQPNQHEDDISVVSILLK